MKASYFQKLQKCCAYNLSAWLHISFVVVIVVVVLIWHNFHPSPLSARLTPWFLTNPRKDFKLPQGRFLILCFQYILPKLLTQLCSPWGYWIEFPEANGSTSERDTPAVCPLQLDPGCYQLCILKDSSCPSTSCTSTSCGHLFQQLLVFHRQPVLVPSRAELSLYFPWYKEWIHEKLRANSNFQFTF